MPVPDFLSLNPFAIDISPNSVRVLKLEKKIGGLEPVFYKTFNIPKTCDILSENIDTAQCADLLEILKELKDKYKVNYALFSLPEIKTYTFETYLPKEAGSNIEEALKFQIEENVPLPPEEVSYEFDLLNDATETNIKVSVTALPKLAIQSLTRFVLGAGITPISFETESIAIAKAVLERKHSEPTLLVRFGETYTSAAVSENGMIKYTTTFAVSGKEISENPGGDDSNSLKEEINKLLIYWFTGRQKETNPNKISRVILCGKPAIVPGVKDYFERHLKVKVEVANVWRNCFDINKKIPKISKEDSMELAITIGLLL